MDVTKIQGTDKLWGTTWLVSLTKVCQVSFIKVVPGGYCSTHIHERKSNKFFVVTGSLEVRWWDSKQVLSQRRTLHPLESLTVPAGIAHQFEASHGAMAIETYHSEVTGIHVNPDDIERLSNGGVRDGAS